MVEIAGDHVGTAAKHGPERIGAALQIDQIDGKAGALEFAKLQGQHGRQIAQAAGAPDRDRDLALCCRQIGRQHQRQQRRGKPAQNHSHDLLRVPIRGAR
jgi:hypothetical protein